MADVVLSPTEYTDLYDETGIIVGTALKIQNKSSNIVHVKGAASSKDGFILVAYPKFEVLDVIARESGCWAIGSGPVNVREV